jgi:hypothetical protein
LIELSQKRLSERTLRAYIRTYVGDTKYY